MEISYDSTTKNIIYTPTPGDVEGLVFYPIKLISTENFNTNIPYVRVYGFPIALIGSLLPLAGGSIVITDMEDGSFLLTAEDLIAGIEVWLVGSPDETINSRVYVEACEADGSPFLGICQMRIKDVNGDWHQIEAIKGETGDIGATGAQGIGIESVYFVNGWLNVRYTTDIAQTIGKVIPIRGTDYWTEADIATINTYIDGKIDPYNAALEDILGGGVD